MVWALLTSFFKSGIITYYCNILGITKSLSYLIGDKCVRKFFSLLFSFFKGRLDFKIIV